MRGSKTEGDDPSTVGVEIHGMERDGVQFKVYDLAGQVGALGPVFVASTGERVKGWALSDDGHVFLGVLPSMRCGMKASIRRLMA